ncbi:hypothetical protein [Phenylobacterium sp. J367]|uniref:hypothetical protein n=1 Tax=Phenylobacterium sp. J367 TaxID=2898435 RepID=UPI002151788C|nr:hypothetical protein [Phenylobacterium sp. J367]MCR5879059.1 hypothetical protein [Phenylobacterium sp. J367]
MTRTLPSSPPRPARSRSPPALPSPPARPPVALPQELAARSHINVVRMTSDWVSGNPDFTDTFTDAVHENLADCARGPQKLDLNLHVSHTRREDRLMQLFQGGGRHEIAGVAEFVDPATKEVVGRYPIDLVVDAGGPVEAVFADRQLMISDAFATELCRQAFGRG